jgi:hypothetical protein
VAEEVRSTTETGVERVDYDFVVFGGGGVGGKRVDERSEFADEKDLNVFREIISCTPLSVSLQDIEPENTC